MEMRVWSFMRDCISVKVSEDEAKFEEKKERKVMKKNRVVVP